MKLKAIDISYAQPAVDFSLVKKAGVKAVIVRNGYLNKTDTHFVQHVKGAVEAGLDIGSYTYIMADTVAQAKIEAEQTVDRLRQFKGYLNYPVFCDMESQKYYDEQKFSKRLRTDIILTFCEEIKKAGYYPAVYINPAWLEQWVFKNEILNKYDIWLAAWTDSPEKATRYDYCQTMWQWGTEKINGIAKPVDSDLVYVDYPDKIRKTGLNFLPSEAKNKKKVNDVYLSYGQAAIRSHPMRADNVLSRCVKGGYYAISGTLEVDDEVWLKHADGSGYSMLKDGLILFRKVGSYSTYKTTDLVNVRSTAEITSKNDVGNIKRGSTVYATSNEVGKWVEIIHEGKLRYVHRDYLKKGS